MIVPRRQFPLISALIFLLATIAPALNAASPKVLQQGSPEIIVEQLADGLGIPWGMTFISAQQLLISERAGRLRLLDLKKLSLVTISGLPDIAASGQGGLMEIITGPDFINNGWIYFSYSKATNSGNATTLARAKLAGTKLEQWQDLIVTDSGSDTGRHFGGRIAFDNNGHVFLGIGDRGERDQAQNLENHQGTIIRLNLDGSVPGDNPFVSQSNARAEIWSYGHRNPQGLVYDAGNHRLWSIEHGPRGGDEINLIQKKGNYGWPVVSHGKEYWGPVSIGEGTSKPGMVDPVKVYIPSIAPGSLLLYQGDQFPQWRGNLFAGALKLQHINRVSLSAQGRAISEHRLLESLRRRVRHIIQSPQGDIIFSTDRGEILRLSPSP
ncbi:MAG: glucose/arabinose dehydrogenase [Planctomycetota bacterium]|jgi:glucose/arabinose dehydrogenase